MCGRYTREIDVPVIAARWRATPAARTPLHLVPNMDVRPRQQVPIIALGSDRQRKIIMASWGLVPPDSETDKPKFPAINARSDKLRQVDLWRHPMKKGRLALFPANAFFEWQKLPDGGKQQHLIRMKDQRPFLMAGLWESWRAPAGAANAEPLITCTIITVEPNSVVSPIHDRMPAIIPDDDAALWLREVSARDDELQDLLRPFPAGQMEALPYAPSPRNDALI